MLIKMKKGEQFADVHPDEVENFKSGDWVLMEEQPEAKKRGRAKSNEGKQDNNSRAVG